MTLTQADQGSVGQKSIRRQPPLPSRSIAPRWIRWLCWSLAWIMSGSEVLAQDNPDSPQFNRDIRPILSDLCFQCHGPDQAARQGNLRLDLESSAIGTDNAPSAIVRGNPDASELLRRLTTTDPDERMPPPSTGRQATPQQIELLRRWISAGAEWEGHWSFQPLRRPSVPELARDASSGRLLVASDRAPRSPLDVFVQQRLPDARLQPSPSAPRETALRRLSLDLVGLPPTLDSLDEFLADDGPDAYQRQVDRLLASPFFGERFGIRWLDAARYADTSGYQSDGPRHMWRWRDWVLDAINRDLPFDQFTIEQLAGDLLPSPTLDQRIATGFHRNHRGNSEGGIIPEEYAVEYVVDRVDTTGTVWLGLTLGCARCHEHKFDPISQREYYQLFAYFNNVPEFGRAIKEGNSPPFIPAPTLLQREQLEQLDSQLTEAERTWKSLDAQRTREQAEWEERLRARKEDPFPAESRWGFPSTNLVFHATLDEPPPGPTRAGDDASDSGSNTTADASRGLTRVPGAIGMASNFPGDRAWEVGDIGGFGYFDAFSISLWVRPDPERGGTIVSKMSDVAQGDGYSIELQKGRLRLNFVKRWLDDALRVESRDKLQPLVWQHILVVYDGSRSASGVRLFVDGHPSPLETQLDALNQTFATKEPFRIGGGGGADARFHGQLDEVRVYRGALGLEEAQRLASASTLNQILRTDVAGRTPGQQAKLSDEFLARGASAVLVDAAARQRELIAQRRLLLDRVSTVMVMEEMPTPRPTYVLRRGEYDKPAERVTPGIPPSLGPVPTKLPHNRLGLAHWLVSPDQPLTARVAVNRAWQMMFGAGLVKTVEDFGSQGTPPSHPELLDWLASEFQHSPHDPWSVKRLAREIVSSHTYRQSSRWTGEAAVRDPENRWLARGPRVRLPAESIRDQALAASGLLVHRIGGPSVKPYQPADLWKELATDVNYDQGRGADLYRRTLYTYWKRTVAPPTLVTFDAAGREACVVRESRTNTPLQALALLNEVTFVEAARHLAQRALAESPPMDNARAAHMFRLTTSRVPSPRELHVLVAGLAAHRERFARDEAAARELLTQGESPRDARWEPAELAAWTTVAEVILNLDETVTKD